MLNAGVVTTIGITPHDYALSWRKLANDPFLVVQQPIPMKSYRATGVESVQHLMMCYRGPNASRIAGVMGNQMNRVLVRFLRVEPKWEV